jgi:hypothetical protein
MGVCPLAAFGTGCLPGPFPKITFKSLTISNTSSPVWRLVLPQNSASPLKCLPFSLIDVWAKEIDDAPDTPPS